MSEIRPFRFGLAIDGMPSREQWTDLAQKVEDQGYATLLLPDHFITTFPPLVALMAAADATKTLRVSSFVFDNDFRHPVLLAKEVATLDLLSGGRFECGIGAGWHKPEYEQVGLAFERAGVRIRRLEEAVRILKQFFTEETLNFTGDYYTVTGLQPAPKPFQRPHPPILMGGGGKKLLTLAGQEADIVGLHFKINDDGSVDDSEHTEAAIERKIEWVRQAAGERFASIELNLLLSGVTITPDRLQVAEQHLEKWGLQETTAEQFLESPYVLIGSVEQIVERLQQLRERLGISYIVCRFDDMEMFAPIVARLAGS